MADPESSLLFFDTFSHAQSEDLNLDLVQFPHPVLIKEVHIVPLGTMIHADVPGGQRLGATNPSGFKLELFVNNLAKPNNATFEKLGRITFASGGESCIKAEAEIPTDGLILKGWYSTMTVGVFGCLTTVKGRTASPPPPPPPQNVQSPRIKQESQPVGQQDYHQQAPQPVPPPLSDKSREWAAVSRQEVEYHPHPVAPVQVKQEAFEVDNRYVQPNPLEMHHGRPPVADLPPLPAYSNPHAGVRPPEPPHPMGHPGEPPHGIIATEPPHSTQSVGPGGHPQEHVVGHPGEMPHGLMHPGEPQRSIGMPMDPQHGMVPPQEHQIGSLPQMIHNPSMEGMGRTPDMREIHEAMESFDAERRHEHERERRYRSDSRDGDYRDYRGSREGSRDRDSFGRESRDHRDRSREHGRDRPREREHDWDHDRGRDWERRDRDREDWDHGKDWDKDRSRGRDDYKGRDKDSKDKQRPRSPIFRSRASPRSRSPMSRESSRSRDIENVEDIVEHGEPGDEPADGPFDPMSPEPQGDMYVTLSDIEANANQERDQAIEVDDGGGYEDISDDDIDDMDDFRGMVDGIFEVPEDMWNYTSYSPYQFELLPLTTFSDPSLSPYQVERLRSKLSHKEMPQEALDVLDLVTRFLEAEHTGEWVEAMENLPSLLSNGLSYLGKEDIIDTFILWTLEGLDFDKAIAQPENKYKLRHLKMGIKLVGALCSCDVNICLKMMKEEVQMKLLRLYVTDHMSLSVKLQILRSVDQTLRFQTGMDWFLGLHPLQVERRAGKDGTPAHDTAYQALIDIMMTKQLVRATVAISAILKKVNAYEVVRNFQEAVESFLDKSSVDQAEEKLVKTEDSDTAEEPETMIDIIPGQPGTQDLEMDKITHLLDDLTKIHASALHALGFPGRTLPAKIQFQITQKPSDPYPFLYHIWHSCNLLESIFSLLLHPATYQHLTAFLAIRDFIVQLSAFNSGLQFIASRPEIANGIIRALLQNSQEDVREEGSDENPPQQLGLQLVYYLQTLQFVDLLFEYHKKEKHERDDEQDMISFLHGLYIMTFVPLGREAVTKVTTYGDNLKALVTFLEIGANEAREGPVRKSVPLSYACNLLSIIIQDSDNVEMLERFGKKLYAICELEIHPKLSAVKQWLDPISKLDDFTYNSLDELMTQLKQYTEEVTDLPRGLVTTLRIIHHCGIPSEREVLDEGQVELRYRYVLTELFTGDCMVLFQTILLKLCEIQQRSWQQGSYLATTQGRVSMAIIVKIVALAKAILQYLIMARAAQFRDTTFLPALFSVHTVVCSAPPSGVLSPDAQKVQNDIIDTIMAFTQPSLESYESEDVLSQSLWTKTLEELFKYTLSSPYTYMSGLLILSELLPLPLPIQTKEPLSDEEIAMATNQRKLWSAHLLCCNSAIQEIIKTLATTSCQPLQHVMRRVCWQLADLSMPTALNLVKHILDLILDGLESITEVVSIPGEGEKTQEVVIFHPSSGDMAQALILLAYLLSQAPVKAPMLHLLRSGAKSEERYMETLPKLLHLLNVVAEKTCHIQAQECIVSIIQSLCDPEIVLVGGENMPVLEQLSICLPSKDHLHQICLALLDHIGNIDHSYASILPALRTLVMLTEHDYGFFHLKGALDQNHFFAFRNLFMRINNTFSKDSSDCLSTLSTATELLHLLVTLEAPEEEQTPLRTFVISVAELRQYLSWVEEGDHPLYDLEKLLVECAKEEEALDSLLEGITSLLHDLRSNESAEKKELVEPILPTPESLMNQFNSRPIFVLTDGEDDRLSINYWLSCPGVEDSDQECELVPCDFQELTQKCNLDFDLMAELAKGTSSEDTNATKLRKRPRVRGARDTINTSSRGRGSKGFVAPMRGRGFNRGMSSNRHDPFRSRPPNTSRPPSMHVDDFVKMESQQGPPKPGGAAAGPPRRDKDFGIHGGRGGRGGFDRGRGGPGRGRFFTPPGNYGRRDGMNTRGAGNRGGLSRGGPLPPSRGPPGRSMQTPWGGRSKQMSSPRGFGGRGRDMDSHLGSAERHTGRDVPRFSSRGAGSAGRGGRGQWISPKSRDDTRFMPPPGGGFRGRRDQGRHARSFTK